MRHNLLTTQYNNLQRQVNGLDLLESISVLLIDEGKNMSLTGAKDKIGDDASFRRFTNTESVEQTFASDWLNCFQSV